MPHYLNNFLIIQTSLIILFLHTASVPRFPLSCNSSSISLDYVCLDSLAHLCIQFFYSLLLPLHPVISCRLVELKLVLLTRKFYIL